MSLVGKARARPDQVKKVLETVQQQGALTAYKKAMNRLDSYSPLGYSLAGVVEEVGKGAEEFSVGQLVACAGNEFALHAEINWVPTNLCVAVPDGVSPQLAAFRHRGFDRTARRSSGQCPDRGHRVRHRPGPGRSVGRPAAGGLRGPGGRPRSRPGPMPAGREGRRPAVRGTGRRRRRLRWSRPCPRPRAVSVPTGSSSSQAAPPTSRWSWRHASHATGQRSSTSASASSTCPGTTTTRRSSTFGSPARTDRVATTPATRSTESTTRRATCDGRSDAISHCFVNAVARKEIDPEPLIAGIFPLRGRARASTSSSSTGVLQGVGFLFEYDEPDEADPGGSESQPGRCAYGAWSGTADAASIAPREPPSTGGENERPADRLRRCRELRVVDAASAPREAAGGRAGSRRHPPLALGRQRAAQVRFQ